ncbi:MAG TPA: DUF4180 domain-containing protein [Spirochaetia bacterium]|nr:DUF4180 domain-containing protein [Spirochaetia bacterium]
MELIVHRSGENSVVEARADEVIVRDEQDVLDLMASAQHLHRARAVVVHAVNLADDFFSLKTGLAGAILQKISNYRFRLAIVGDFAQPESDALRDFIRESNRGGQVLFVASVEDALGRFEIRN